ncbi:MAG: xanthine dehydrogenase family protein molybdopterin-binding subunit [Deltaproteobacteria bacterium]|nr:xanthine dehydrogenase family protein molybdopterin-binding subunit [Deltaproteobacteria bacterium]
MAKELTIVGKRHPKIDGGERVSGKAEYASDITLPGMLYGKILRSPHPHAKIIKIDAEKAKALPGVKAVLTAKDIADFPWYQTPGRSHHDMPLLVDIARFTGDDVAVVAAVDEDTAQEALDLIQVGYQILPFVLDPEEALKPAAPKIHPKGNLAGEKPAVLNRGNIEKGFQEADLIYEGRYTTPMLQHVTAEPRVCVARWNRGKLTVWDSLAYTFAPQATLAHIFKIPMSKVRIICDFMGGSFGDKNMTERYTVLASILSMKTGQPVRIEFDREESFLATTHRYPMVCYLKYGAKKDGTLTAIQAKVIADMGAYRHLAGASGIMETMKCVYRCPNLKAEGYDVYTNKPEGGFMRCVGHPQGQVAQEIHMDIMAEKLGIDPVAFRLKNHARLEDGDQDTKAPFSSNGMEECIRKGAEAFGWTQRWQKPGASQGPIKKGLGMAIHSCRHGAMVLPSTGTVKLNSDGTVNLFVGTVDIGASQKSTMAMIAAEELGVPLDAVSVTSADTEMTLDSGSSGGSKQTIGSGTAVKLAAADAKTQLLEIAAREFKTGKENLVIKSGSIYPSGSDKGMKIADVLKKAPATITGRGTAALPKGVVTYCFAAHFIEVEVDTLTGKVRLLKLVAAHDVGKAINLLGAENQVDGGAIQGMGFGLTEDQITDKATGICVNPNLVDYKLLTMKDIPEIQPLFIEPIDPVGPFGAKGLGEPPYSVPAPAIANAIYNAIGVRFTDLPLNIRSILEGRSTGSKA